MSLVVKIKAITQDIVHAFSSHHKECMHKQSQLISWHNDHYSMYTFDVDGSSQTNPGMTWVW